MRMQAVATLLATGLTMTLGGDLRAQSCGDTLTSDTVLASSLSCAGAGLTIASDDITLDCAGFTITGSGTDTGILLDGVTGVTVQNCTVINFSIGIWLDGASANYLTTNGALSNTSTGSGGFRIGVGSNGNVLEQNRSSDNAGRGFVLSSSEGNLLFRNTAVANDFRGFDLIDSPSNTLAVNIADANTSAGYVMSGTSSANILFRNSGNANLSEGYASFSAVNYLSFNSANQNGTFGYTDSTGPANLYLFDQCSGNTSGGASPTGLCTPQP